MIREVCVYESPLDSLDPYMNLAREEVLLDRLRPGQVLLYLWQNRHTVVIGRNQNAYKECRVALLEKEGGHLSRRLSGGGAVYHDMGNLNYTFMAMREDYDVPLQTRVILEAVRGYGIEAEATGRNDIQARGRKFSGNAYYRTAGACYHHGTLLVAVDPERMERYLQVDREKLKTKGVASVRSRVLGLQELCPEVTIEGLRKRVRSSFLEQYAGNGLPVKELSLEDAETIEEAAARLREKYASPVWIYGEKTAYSYEIEKRFAWGKVQLALDIRNGVIAEAEVYTDALQLDWPVWLKQRLTGRRFEPAAVRALYSEEGPSPLILDEIIDWMEESM